jgi:hypothetical protein
VTEEPKKELVLANAAYDMSKGSKRVLATFGKDNE